MNLIDKSIYENLDLLPEDSSGWNGKSELFKTLIEDLRPKTIIEVGTWKGQSAITMGNAIKNLGLSTKIHCVDTWLGAIEFQGFLKDTHERNLVLKNGYPQVYFQFLSNVVHHGLEDIILPFPNTSENGYRYFKENNVSPELIYIDASHEEDDVYRDITNYYNLLSVGGVIFGDDYISWVGVNKSVNRFAEENNLTFDVIENNFWLITKK